MALITMISFIQMSYCKQSGAVLCVIVEKIHIYKVLHLFQLDFYINTKLPIHSNMLFF